MRFVLTINLGNDAMLTNEDIETALRYVAKDLTRGETTRYHVPMIGDNGAIRDDYGNTVGQWDVVDTGKETK